MASFCHGNGTKRDPLARLSWRPLLLRLIAPPGLLNCNSLSNPGDIRSQASYPRTTRIDRRKGPVPDRSHAPTAPQRNTGGGCASLQVAAHTFGKPVKCNHCDHCDQCDYPNGAVAVTPAKCDHCDRYTGHSCGHTSLSSFWNKFFCPLNCDHPQLTRRISCGCRRWLADGSWVCRQDMCQPD